MELKIDKEPVYVTEVVYDGQAEQGVEFDYVLPDYYPDIFKVLKCTLTPCVISYSISGTQLYCDGVVYIRVLYLSEGSSTINCITQRYTYSKTTDLMKPTDNACVTITPKTDYVNCRAVSGRRIDVRGAVSCKIKVTCEREAEIITAVSGMGVQSRSSSLSYCGKKLAASKQFIVREDIETGSGKGGIIAVISADVCTNVTDCRIVSDKAVIKGEAVVKALYLVRRSETETETEVMEASVPLSQIIDLQGLTDKHSCCAELRLMDCDLEIKANESGENRMFACDLTIDCRVCATLPCTVYPVSDLYSTDFESSFKTAPVKMEASPQYMSQPLFIKSTAEAPEGELQTVFDSRCDVVNVMCRRKSDRELAVTGQANIQVIGALSDGTPVFAEKNEPFELIAELPELAEDYTVEPDLQVASVTYSISDGGKADVRVGFNLRGCVYNTANAVIIRDIEVNAEKPKQKDNEYALKLYFADANEEIWDIAKAYNTGAAAILAENEIEGDKSNKPEKLEKPCMLLIPIA